jgi:hypothetical protein
MTREELDSRDKDICALYMEGKSLAECGLKYGIGRQRVKQIVEKAGLWREPKPVPLSGRDELLGVLISDDDKKTLRAEARRRGISMSEMTAEWIKNKLAELGTVVELEDTNGQPGK